MLKIYKLYLKWKLKALLKDKILQYHIEKQKNLDLYEEWKGRECGVMKMDCFLKEVFEEDKKQKTLWFYEQYKIGFDKIQTIEEVIEIIEKL